MLLPRCTPTCKSRTVNLAARTGSEAGHNSLCAFLVHLPALILQMAVDALIPPYGETVKSRRHAPILSIKRYSFIFGETERHALFLRSLPIQPRMLTSVITGGISRDHNTDEAEQAPQVTGYFAPPFHPYLPSDSSILSDFPLHCKKKHRSTAIFGMSRPEKTVRHDKSNRHHGQGVCRSRRWISNTRELII